jgi:hypothetical protein
MCGCVREEEARADFAPVLCGHSSLLGDKQCSKQWWQLPGAGCWTGASCSLPGHTGLYCWLGPTCMSLSLS